jgi:hypothetical protein
LRHYANGASESLCCGNIFPHLLRDKKQQNKKVTAYFDKNKLVRIAQT